MNELEKIAENLCYLCRRYKGESYGKPVWENLPDYVREQWRTEAGILLALYKDKEERC